MNSKTQKSAFLFFFQLGAGLPLRVSGLAGGLLCVGVRPPLLQPWYLQNDPIDWLIAPTVVEALNVNVPPRSWHHQPSPPLP